MGMEVTLALIAVALLFIMTSALRADRKRIGDLEKVAAEMGCEFAAGRWWFGGMRELSKEFRFFSLFGRLGHCTNLLRKRDDREELVIFDFLYSKSETSYRQTVFIIRDSSAEPPGLLVRPRRLLDKLPLVAEELRLAAPSDFSRKYLVRRFNPLDEARVREIFNSRLLLGIFEGTPDLCVESQRGWLLVYRKGTLVEPSAIAAGAEQARAIMSELTRSHS